MWFFVALFVAGFILTAFLSPKMKTENAKAAGLNEFNFPRSKEGDPVGRYYGTVKVLSPNTIGLANFKAVPIKKKVKTGLFSSKKVITGYKYYATVDMAIALGSRLGLEVRKMWFGENLVWTGCEACYQVIPIDLPELYGGSLDGNRGGIGGDVIFYCGKFDQEHDPILAEQLDPDISAYPGIAHAVFRDFWFGNSPNIEPIYFEVRYFSNSLELPQGMQWMPNGLDANPIEVLHDILTTQWGNLGFDPAYINKDQWRDIAIAIRNENNGMSLIINSPTEGTDVAKQILRQINAIVFENPTNGLVDIKLIRNDYNINTLPILDPSNISEVRNFTKKLWPETNNVVRLKFTGRDQAKHIYEYDKIAIAQDFGLLRYQKKERPVEITMPGVYEKPLANALAARELSNLNVPIYSCELTIDRTVPGLLPGSVFKMTWPEYGMVQIIMRIRKMGMGSLRDNKITLSVVQDEFSLDATLQAPPTTTGYEPTTTVPMTILKKRLFELPAYIDLNSDLETLVGQTRVMAFAGHPGSQSYGFDIITSSGVEPTLPVVVDRNSYHAYATLNGSILRFDGFEQDAVIASISLRDFHPGDDELPTAPETRAGEGMFVIDEELFIYTTAVFNGDGTVDLTDVHRAVLDSEWRPHFDGADVWFFNGLEGAFDVASEPGATVRARWLDHTASGTDAPSWTEDKYLVTVGRVGRVVAPDYVTIDGSRDPEPVLSTGQEVEVDVRTRSRLSLDGIRWENDPSDAPEAGTTYQVAYERNGVETVVADDVAMPYTLTVPEPMVDATLMLVRAKRGGLYSIGSSPFPIKIEQFLTVDGDVVTVDGEEVEVN